MRPSSASTSRVVASLPRSRTPCFLDSASTPSGVTDPIPWRSAVSYSLRSSTTDRRSHILVLTDTGKAVLARAKKLVATKHEARLNDLLGQSNREALLGMLSKIANEF